MQKAELSVLSLWWCGGKHWFSKAQLCCCLMSFFCFVLFFWAEFLEFWEFWLGRLRWVRRGLFTHGTTEGCHPQLLVPGEKATLGEKGGWVLSKRSLSNKGSLARSALSLTGRNIPEYRCTPPSSFPFFFAVVLFPWMSGPLPLSLSLFFSLCCSHNPSLFLFISTAFIYLSLTLSCSEVLLGWRLMCTLWVDPRDWGLAAKAHPQPFRPGSALNISINALDYNLHMRSCYCCPAVYEQEIQTRN